MRTYEEIMDDETLNLESDDALYELGLCFIEGRGCAKNMEKGIQYLKEAESLGNQFASDKLSKINTQSVKQVPQQEAIDYDKESLISLYQMATKHDLKAAIALSSKVGDDMKQDVFELFKNLSKVEDDDIDSVVEIQYRLGEMYEDGCGDLHQINPQQAFLCYCNAWELHHPKAAQKLATCYENGFGTKRDLSKAMELRIQYGTLEDKYRMAEYYDEGLKVEKSLLKSLQLLDEIARSPEKDIYRAIANLRLMEEHETSYMELEDILEQLKEAVEQHHADATYVLAQAYLHGKAFPQDEDAGLYYLHQLHVQNATEFILKHRVNAQIFNIIAQTREEATFLNRIQRYHCDEKLWVQGVFHGFEAVTNQLLRDVKEKDADTVKKLESIFTYQIKVTPVLYSDNEVAQRMIDELLDAMSQRIEQDKLLRKKQYEQHKKQQEKEEQREHTHTVIENLLKNPFFVLALMFGVISLIMKSIGYALDIVFSTPVFIIALIAVVGYIFLKKKSS